MAEPYKWKLSPSKFAGSRGCPCYREEDSYGKEYKERGTDLHELVQFEDKPLDGLDETARAAVLFCREYKRTLRGAVEVEWEMDEASVPATYQHPRGKLDWVVLTKDGQILIRDWKFGTVEVSAENNPQLEAYALMAYHTLLGGRKEVSVISVGVVQPALLASPDVEIPLSELPRIERDLKTANDRVTDPVKLPDASDPDKCKRCEHLHRCPAVVKGISLATHSFGLPMPENFDPGALVSERQRVIAQDLAVILESWSSRVKELNKEYAIQNGGTLGGIWSVSQRANGVEIQDLRGFAQALVDDGVLENPDQLLDFVKLQKTKLVEGLSGPDRDVGPIVAALEQQMGVPRPPVTVFRRGGAKQTRPAEELLDIPQLPNPFKRKKED